MRFKYYLRGAGIGIILTTLIFTISIAATKDHNTLTDAEIAARAEEMGYVIIGEDSKPEEEAEESTDSSNENVETDMKSAFTKEDKSASSEVSKIEEETEKLPNNTAENTSSKKSSDSVVEYKAFTISPGQSSITVAKNLYEAGLVSDEKEFSDYMDKLGVDNRLQSGSFYLSTDMSYDDIVAVLVTKQDLRENKTLPENAN